MSSVASSTSSTAASTATATSSAGSSVISSQGIGSGLNIGSIVSILTTAQGAAQTSQYAAQQTTYSSQVSAYATFGSALDTLQATIVGLTDPTKLAGFDATLGDTTIATASASSGAVAGTYSLAVTNLATPATLTSAAVSGSATTIGTGTLTLSVGTSSTSISIDATDNTLSGIAAAINGATNNPGVSASVITTTDGSRLVLSGTTTGAGNTISVSESGGDGGLSALVYDAANPTATTNTLTQTTAPADANFSINGYAATSASNVVTGAISGVTLNLLKASASTTSTATPPVTTATPTTLTIAPDTSGAQTSIGLFVTALNGVLSNISTLTGYNATTGVAGALEGNSVIESFQNQLENILDTVTASNSSGISSLSDLGITADQDGNYDSDSTKLGNALSSSLTGVANLLGGTNGIATQLNNLVNDYTQPGGVLATINTGLQSSISNVTAEQAALTARLATYSATLTAEYNAMDTTVALLKQTQTYLTAEFNPNSSSTAASTGLSSGTVSS
jgi:flagellar hook-associated protein 2